MSSATRAPPGTPETIETVCKKITEVEKELREVETIISKSTKELEQGRRRYWELRNELDHLRALVAPITRLPYEILARIFEMAYDEEDDEPEWFETLPKKEEEEEDHLPTVVSHVNRLFRHVAITTPSLWTYINMSEGPPYDRTKLWMERAKSCPLKIDIDFSDFNDSFDRFGALEVILPISRWGTFVLRVDSLYAMYDVLQHCTGTGAPDLRLLELINDSNPYDEDDLEAPELKEPLDLFKGDAPMLEDVVLYGVHLRWNQPMLAGLRNLELEYHPNEVKPTVDQWTTLLRASPGLTLLAVRASGPYLPEDNITNPVALSEKAMTKLEHLEELKVADLRSSELSFVLRMLIIPSLQSLSIENMEYEDNDYTETFLLVSSARYPMLKKFSFGYCRIISDEAIAALFRGLPTVEELELREQANVVLPVFVLAGETTSADEQIILPKLQSLKAKGCEENTLVTYVKQRQRLGHALTRLLVEVNDAEHLQEQHTTFFRQHLTFGFFEGSDGEDTDPFDEEDYTIDNSLFSDTSSMQTHYDLLLDDEEEDETGEHEDEWIDED